MCGELEVEFQCSSLDIFVATSLTFVGVGRLSEVEGIVFFNRASWANPKISAFPTPNFATNIVGKMGRFIILRGTSSWCSQK